MTEPDAELTAKLAAEAQHAETTADLELAYRRRRLPGGQAVYGLRLPTERIAQLRRLAAARGIEPSVLARRWMIEQLDRAESVDPRDEVAERWERDFRVTSEHLRRLLDERPGA